ncbi:hypothetical protein B0H67DRAFT_520883 [Lasiosphaeris hirsuta]|uniref:Cellobiose dehydrogenase-like cytochrome domain-containing protein n=1 Tax=Lasiosphaeris hirsuta TaxID=260670 RepID=A0AA40A343_9PEZI|nr:hypothetical protein B0H67DRAFT_520883 [Lasiosphaeris hirsuta]
MRSSTLLATAAALASTVSAQSGSGGVTTQYADAATGINFQSFTTPAGYRFGLVLPPATDASNKDLIIHLTSPLNSAGAGWAGIDFGRSMVGPLMLVAWPSGSTSNPVIMAPRVARGYKPSDTTPYTTNAITLTPIAKGTFVNSTHLSATFVCSGCLNSDSFDPTTSGTASFAYAYSLVAVATPADANSRLSDHTSQGEGYGSFGADLASARSADFGAYVKLAQTAATTTTTTTAGGGEETRAPTAAPAPEASAPASGGEGGHGNGEVVDMEYRQMGPGAVAALALVGVLYLLQALSVI